MPSKRLEFAGGHGHQLEGRLETPDGAIKAYAIFAHCFTCGKDVFAAIRIARALTAHGVAVLRFDFTGLGASKGDFADTNFSSNVEDLLAAAAYLRDHHAAPRLLIGHSLGGTAVLAAAAHLPEVKAIATIAAPSSPAYVTGMFGEHLEQIASAGEAPVRLAGRSFRIKQQFVEDAGKHNIKVKVAALKRALMVMHAPGDDTVAIGNAMEIFTAAKHPKSFISLDSMDHLLTGREDAAYVADLIAAWSGRYLEEAA